MNQFFLLSIITIMMMMVVKNCVIMYHSLFTLSLITDIQLKEMEINKRKEINDLEDSLILIKFL